MHKTHTQISVQNKMHLEKNYFRKKSHPFTKGSVGACMQIFQNHTTAKDENLYMCYKNIILGKKNSIASSHKSNLSVSRSYGWYNPTLSANPLIEP